MCLLRVLRALRAPAEGRVQTPLEHSPHSRVSLLNGLHDCCISGITRHLQSSGITRHFGSIDDLLLRYA